MGCLTGVSHTYGGINLVDKSSPNVVNKKLYLSVAYEFDVNLDFNRHKWNTSRP